MWYTTNFLVVYSWYGWERTRGWVLFANVFFMICGYVESVGWAILGVHNRVSWLFSLICYLFDYTCIMVANLTTYMLPVKRKLYLKSLKSILTVFVTVILGEGAVRYSMSSYFSSQDAAYRVLIRGQFQEQKRLHQHTNTDPLGGKYAKDDKNDKIDASSSVDPN